MTLYFSRPSAAAGSGDAGSRAAGSEELSFEWSKAEELELSEGSGVERTEVSDAEMFRDCEEAAGPVGRAIAAMKTKRSDLRWTPLGIFKVVMKPPGLCSCLN
jgi:hypothetical protein